MACNWSNVDYFAQLMSKDSRSHTALEMLVDDLHTDKERTVTTFLCRAGSEDFLWVLVRLLGSSTHRVAGNAAYIIGTLAESELGCYRILSLAKGYHPEGKSLLSDLTQMLTSDDPESVMNAAGTMGTLAERADGREWMLSEPCIDSLVDHVTDLLHSENVWTSSNAALVLARLSISEKGCFCILNHPHCLHILSCLIQALGVDEAGRGMNAAFAVGRLCDMDAGRQCLLSLPDSDKMVSSLVKMLSCKDAGASKNACYALSCLAASVEGHEHLLTNLHCGVVVCSLSQLLGAEDSETGWFAAMTLRTLASRPKGCIKLREFPHLQSTLQKVEQLEGVSPDLKEEVQITLEMLKTLDPPDAPCVTVLNSSMCSVSWKKLNSKFGFGIDYQLFEGTNSVYNGPDCQFEVNSLLPNTTYSFKVRAITEVDQTDFSEPTTITTEEDLPEAPQNLRILGATATQLKVGWSPPERFNGISKGYYVYQGKTFVEHTTERSAIISSLTANTSYEIQVCAATSKGKGPRASCTGTTAEMGAHAPGKPHVQVLGRNEVHVSWEPPEVPLGRITRYDVSMNGKIIYSGIELSYAAHRLTPDTEYSFIVTALTNEGKFDSKATKKRTAKDEFDPDRLPLYQPPKREDEPQKSASQKKRKSSGEIRSSRVQSAKESQDSSDHSIMATKSAKSGKGKENNSPPPSPVQKTKVKDLSTTKEHVLSRAKTELIPSPPHRNSVPSLCELPSGGSAPKLFTSRSGEAWKHSPPVTLSYVSVPGTDDRSRLHDSAGPEPVNHKTLFQVLPSHSDIIQTMRVERPRTTISQNNPRLSKPVRFDKLDSSNNDSLHHTLDSSPQPSHNSSNFSLTYSPNEKSQLLPKPTVPSLDYLDGNRGASGFSGLSSATSSIVSPRISINQEIEHLRESTSLESHIHQGKKKNGAHKSLHSLHSGILTDPIYQAFVHRTNTFIRSHRPSLTKTYTTNVPLQMVGSATCHQPSNKLGTSHTHNRFVPVQMRAQPNNLTSNQLQRLNTTLAKTSLTSTIDRKQEALARSCTHIDLRLQPQSNTTKHLMRLSKT